MGIPDLDLMFDVLDTGVTGYLTSSQLHEFYRDIYFFTIDPKQIEGALMTVCGHNHDGRCSREHFLSVLQELERRKSLEDKIYWDFKALDFEGNNRISIETTLFLFKAVHEDSFSLKTWNSFVRQRTNPESEVSFDEVKLFLCNLPSGGPCEEEEYIQERENLENSSCIAGYNSVKELEQLQADDASLAAEEREKQEKASKLKRSASRRIRRLDHEGVEALLHDDEAWDEEAAKKARQRVTASELIQALRTKYEYIRQSLFTEMLKCHVGEGMWTALSAQEQNERVSQIVVKVKKLRKENKLDGNSLKTLPGSGEVFSFNLMALMGNSRVGAQRLRKEEQKLKELMKEKGKSDIEIEEEVKCLREEATKGSTTAELLLTELERRYAEDKDHLSRSLRGVDGHTMTLEERLLEYSLLLREQLRAKQESQFIPTACSIGLAEDLHQNLAGQDRIRQEKLAHERLLQRKGRKLQREVLSGETLSKGNVGVVDLLEDVVKVLERKQALEREVLVYLLQGRESSRARSYAKKLTSDERTNQLLVLRMQRQAWKDRSSEDKYSSQDRHRAILQEAVGLVFENRKNEIKELSGNILDDIKVSAAILSELQEYQDKESRLLTSLPNKDLQELRRIRTEEEQSINEDWLDNISAVLLGTEEGRGQEDELLKALEDKYDALRDKLLLEALEKQLGADEWARLSEQERQARLLKLKLQEKRLRQQGKFDEAAALLGEGLKNAELLKSLLGENRQRYQDRLKERLARRQRRMEEGRDLDEEDEETLRLLEEEESKSSGNILKDLQNRFDEEKDALLRRLREEQDRFDSEKRRQAELVRLRREKRQAELESKFGSAALVLGLAERNRLKLEERLKGDRERQEQLARDRLANRKGKRSKVEDVTDEPEPDKDDISGWNDSVLKALEKKHRAEQELFMSLLLDESSKDLRQEAREAGEEKRHKQIHELKEKRDELDFGVKAEQELHEDILDMATAYRVEIRRFKLSSNREQEVTNDDVHTTLVADLQEEQDREVETIIAQLQDKTQPQLAEMRQSQIQACRDCVVENVATVLFRYEGPGTDDQILKALDNKYDALKDKLLLEALKKQLGDAEWTALSERERQQRLIKLKLEERRLRQEGKMDELARLLGEGLAMDANLRKLMGDNKARYEEKLKERLAHRRERIAQGLPPDDSDEEEDDDKGEEGSTNVINVLDALDKRYDDEKDALMARLRGDNERFLSERQRQAELARLRREQLKAKQEDQFDSAALVLGLAERNQASAAERLKQDRLRQEQLARERLAQRRGRKSKEKTSEDKLITDADVTAMQENVLKILESKYQHEREVLTELLQEDQRDLISTLEAWTKEQCEERLRELKHKLSSVEPDQEQRRSILLEAAAVKFVNRRNYLQKSREGEVPRDDVIISVLADLQQEQDKESEMVIESMQDKDKKELIELQKEHIKLHQSQSLKNVITTVTRGEGSLEANDDELVQALEDKYDALRDKLIADALMKQIGEAEWKAMSERDRMAKLVQMKLEAKKLKKEGKIDELQKVFEDALANEASLAALMDEKKLDYEKRLKERLAKRRERIQNGMTEEEVAQLEAEEDKEIEEELKKASTGNALLDLEKRLEEEKEALMAGLRGADQRYLNERERQAELARLRRDERRARQEDTFDRAAMVFGLAQTMQANLEEVRKRDQERQRMLARERLEARRNRSKSDIEKEKEKLTNAEQMESAVEVTDPNNIAAIQDAVVKEMELKHACEREVFEIMLNEEKKSDMRKATKNLSLDQMKDRLFELKELRKQWRDSSPDEMAETVDEEEANLREATGLQIEIMLAEKKKNEEIGDNLEEEISVALLANLQQQQDQEEEFLLQDLASKSPVTLQQLRHVQVIARKQKWYDNIAAVLLGVKKLHSASSGQSPSEKELVEALEEKYDALKDKLLADALMKQMGNAEWAALSERERQMKLVKLKLQEKKLREEGKIDEASRLFGEGLKNEASLRALIGQSKSRQKDVLKERLQKLKKMKEDGKKVNESELANLELIEEQGLEAVDSDVLKGITEQALVDSEKATSANLGHDLQSRYEEEKEALLAALRGQDERFRSEKTRQLELAKLRRAQKKLKQEDNVDTAVMLFSMAKKQEAALDSRYKENRSHQEQLARERIAALKARRAAKHKPVSKDDEENEKIAAVIQEITADLESDKLQAMEIHQGGITSLQEAVLDELEQKHTSEQQFLNELVQGAEEDTEGAAAARYLSSEDRQAKIEQIGKARQNWRMDSMRDSQKTIPEQQQQQDERQTYAARIVESRSRQNTLLHDALLLQMESRKQLLIEKGIPEDKLGDEVAVGLLADLQEKQQSESSAMINVLSNKDIDILNQIKEDQRRSRRERWCDNVAAVIVGTRPVRKRSSTMEAPSFMDALGEEDEEEAHLEEKHEEELAALENEMEREKEAKKLSGASEMEINAAMAELERQHKAKRQALEQDVDRQRRMVRERLEARRRKRDEQQYEEDMAASIVTMAQKQFALVREKTMLRRDEAQDSLKDRLAKRRLERQRKKAEEEKSQQQAEENVRAQEAAAERRGSKTLDWPLPPGFSMKREKTVVEVDLSEEKQREIVSSLIREHTSFGKKFERERTRQEDMLKNRRKRKKEKREQREEDAAFILGLGERQKTFVEQQQKGERERQITMIRDRINRVRYERTQTMMESRDENAGKGFSSFQDDEELKGLSEDEKMKKIAAKMEEKFKSEQKRKPSIQVLSPPVASPDGSSLENSEDESARELSHNLLDEKGLQKKLKERMASRRKKSRQQDPIMPPPVEGAEGGT